MPNIYYMQYEVHPAQDNEDFATVGGAYANCFVEAEDETEATEIVQEYFRINHWMVLSLEDGPFLTEADDYEDDPEWLEYFNEAVSEGECFIFHEWPPEAQEDDVIH